MTTAYSLYLHIPFCRHRCAYCDFNTYAGLDTLIPAYCQALAREITLAGQAAGSLLSVHTVFFGGGTPSLIPVNLLAPVFESIGRAFHLTGDAEISLEANPGTVDFSYLQNLRALGVNRLSFGVQSANPEELSLLEREHDFPTVIRSVTAARRAGFANINLDLIFGLPHQTLQTWQNTLEAALRLHPEHLALYALTLEHGTPMQHWAARGLIPEPDPDTAAEMYEWAAARLAQAGFVQYEISNWASAPAFACRHNLQYWHGDAWLGFGAGAHGYLPGLRTVNTLAPRAYINRLHPNAAALPFPRTPATAEVRNLTPEDERGEWLMMRLRLTESGVPTAEFARRFGLDFAKTYSRPIERLQKQGLVEWIDGKNGKALRLTERGHLLANRVFVAFI